MQFSSNGLVTFDSKIDPMNIESLPILSESFVPLLAPLWTSDIDRVENAYVRLTSDQTSLSWVRAMILQSNPDLTDYQPSEAFIITWHELKLPNEDPVSVSKDHSHILTGYLCDEELVTIL